MNKQSFIESKVSAGETKGVNHVQEYARFYNKHKKLCDEISGVKIRSVYDVESPDKTIIGKENFKLAIQRLNSFIIDNIHYISEKIKRRTIKESFKEIQTKFNSDEEYHDLAQNSEHLGPEATVRFEKKYLEYLIMCFELIKELSEYLQSSMMPTTSEIKKTVAFYDQNVFFRNLSDYRDEVSDNLSNITYMGIFENLKKIMGYAYTYGYLLGKRNKEHVFGLLNMCSEFIMDEESIKKVLELRRMKKKGLSFDKLTKSKTQEINEELILLQDAFNAIYMCVNSSLANKNILPKSKRSILIDRSLI